MKLGIRKALGPFYPLLVRIKHSSSVRTAVATTGLLQFRTYCRRHPETLAADIDATMGLGAILATALRLHAYAEDRNRRPCIISTSPLYAEPGQDLFAAYFDRPACPDAPKMGTRAFKWLWLRELPQGLSLERAASLFCEHFRPNARLREAIELAGGGEPFDLAIHVRGTDKFLESGALDLREMLCEIDRHLPAAPARVFLATDDAGIAASVRQEFPMHRFVSFDLGAVAEGTPRHFSDLSPSDKALEALVNIFLIARAPVCVRTSSFLSAISKIANPEQVTVTINRTRAADVRFPEREILEAEQASRRT